MSIGEDRSCGYVRLPRGGTMHRTQDAGVAWVQVRPRGFGAPSLSG